MRFHLRTTQFAKTKARDIQRHLRAAGVEAALTACQGALAGLYGYRDWTELKFVTQKQPVTPCPTDEHAPADVRARRRADQVACLARRFGLGEHPAAAVVDLVAPTALRVPDPEPRSLAEAVSDFVSLPGQTSLPLFLEDEARRALEGHVVHGEDGDVEHFARGRGVDEVCDVAFEPGVEVRDGVLVVEGTLTVSFDEWSHDSEGCSEGFSFLVEISPSDIKVTLSHPDL